MFDSTSAAFDVVKFREKIAGCNGIYAFHSEGDIHICSDIEAMCDTIERLTSENNYMRRAIEAGVRND